MVMLMIMMVSATMLMTLYLVTRRRHRMSFMPATNSRSNIQQVRYGNVNAGVDGDHHDMNDDKSADYRNDDYHTFIFSVKLLLLGVR